MPRIDPNTMQAIGRRLREIPTPSRGATHELRIESNILFTAIITSLNNDYITVKRIDYAGSAVGNFLKVAKPRKLRHIVAHYSQLTGLTTSNTNTVQVTDGTLTENWAATPEYAVNDHILIFRVGLTGLVVSGEELAFIDVNLDARAWSMVSAVTP